MKYSTKKFISPILLIGLLISAIFAASFLIYTAVKTIDGYYALSPVVENMIVRKAIKKPGLPKRLIISSINLDVQIDYVGLTSDNDMDIGPSADVVGWYMLGPRPGDDGSAVIAGHYGWVKGKPAVFNDIQTLNAGDEVSVVDQKGDTFTFVVRKIQKYRPESDATNVFQSKDGKAHLNLITCNGVWINDSATYSNRLVVFTDKK